MLRILVSGLELLAVFVALAVVHAANVQYANWSALTLALLAMLAFSSRIEIPRVNSRGKAFALLCVCLMFAWAGSIIAKQEWEAKLAVLKEENSAAYLAELKNVDKERWLEEAKTLDKPAYEKEMARRAEAKKRERREACGEKQTGMAFVMMQPEVKRRLKSPISAKFPKLEGKGSGPIGDCVFWVHSYVDAANSFGAQIRTPFSGRIRHYPDAGTWQVLSLKIGR